MTFWNRKNKRDFEPEQKEAERILAYETSKLEANRQEFHNLKAVCAIDLVEAYIKEIHRQRTGR